MAGQIQINNLRGVDCCVFLNHYRVPALTPVEDSTIRILIKIRKLLLSNM
jgi:hypothetical protein